MIIFFISFPAVVFLGLLLLSFVDVGRWTRKKTIYFSEKPGKCVVLTFDDGPSPQWTPMILDVLRKRGIRAVFFMLGKHVKKYPETALQVAREGHEIGSHGYSHRLLWGLTRKEIESEIRSTEEEIFKATGAIPRFFRPAKGWISSFHKAQIKKLGYEIALWSVHSKDWMYFGAEALARSVAARVRPGDIILFHDSGNIFGTEGASRLNTVKAVERLCDKLKTDGYRFVTLERPACCLREAG